MRTSDQSVIESETGDEPAYLAQTRKVRARQDETQPSHAAGPIRKVIWWIW